jgi:hypothetical protein
MGYQQAKAEIFASLSRHNSPRDDEDNRLWADLVRRVRAVVEEPQYAAIIADMTDGEL